MFSLLSLLASSIESLMIFDASRENLIFISLPCQIVAAVCVPE